MAETRAWWKVKNAASIAWLGFFVPGMFCYLYFLSVHLNQYEEVKDSKIERLSPKLDAIIPEGAKVRELRSTNLQGR